MATAEPKTEAKPEPKEVQENSGPSLKYKIWVLRVSIHCEGCKKEIARTLKGIDGVYEIELNMKLQKVTVIGNVEPETLIKKLTKSGRHAGLWPDQKGNNNSTDKKKNKGKNKENSESSEESSHGGGAGGDNVREAVKVEVVHAQESANKNKNEGGGSGGNKKVDAANNGKGSGGGGAPAKNGGGGGGGAPAKNGGGGGSQAKNGGGGGGAPSKIGGGSGAQVKESKPEVARQTVNLQRQSAVAEKKSGGGGPGGGGGGGGGGASGRGGKKNKEVEIENANVDDEDSEDEEEWGDDEPPSTEPPHHGNVVGRGPQMSHFPFVPNGPRGLPYGPRGPVFGTQGPASVAHGPRSVQVPSNNNPPRYQNINDFQQPGQVYRPQQQSVHCNAAYPTNGYSAPYHAPPIAHANAYSYAPQDLEAGTQPPSSYHLDAYPPQPYYPPPPYYAPQESYNPPLASDSFGLFSDENPNGCHIM